MNLQERIAKVNKIGTDKVIIEFDNGFGVAYEKHARQIEQICVDSDGVAYDTKDVKAIHVTQKPLGPVHGLESDLIRGNTSYLSPEMEDIVQKPLVSSQKEAKANQKSITKCYDELVKPLGIEEYKYRPWKEIAVNAGGIIGLTLAWPFTTAYMMLGGAKNMHHDAALGIFMAPLGLPAVLYYSAKEILSPSTSAYRVTNRNLLTEKKGDDTAALVFPYDSKATPKRFTTQKIAFPDGLEVSEGKEIVPGFNLIVSLVN